jgi:CO/xanthine dehydrogenase FAD-binding subunit
MKPPAFDYAAPDTLDTALSLLQGSDDAKVLAGGQSLVPLLSFRLAAPSLLVDLARVPDLDGVERRNGTFELGAMVRQRTAEENEELCAQVPLLREALRHVAHPQIRSRGTIGGSIAHADPAAELPAVLLALDGSVRAVSGRGEREVAAGDLYTGFMTTSLDAAEIVTAVAFPAAPPRTGAACVEVARRAGDYALAGALAQTTLGDDGVVADARVALIGVAARPQRAESVETRLVGERPTEAAIASVSRHAADGLNPTGDAQATPDYRRHLARVLVARALRLAAERAA